MKWIIHTEQFKVLLYYYSVNNKNITSPLGTHCVPSQSRASPFTPSHPPGSNYHPTFCVNHSPAFTCGSPLAREDPNNSILENEIAAQSYVCPCQRDTHMRKQAELSL